MADRNFDATSKLTQKFDAAGEYGNSKVDFLLIVWIGFLSLKLC